MPRPLTKTVKKRSIRHNNADARPAKQRKLTSQGTESQPVVLKDTQLSSPREALAIATQADDFESQLRESRPEAEVVAPVEASEAATVASTAPDEAVEDGFDQPFEEERFLQDWRKRGPLGTLLDVINYIKTPQQYEVFRNFQDLANRELPTENQKVLEVVKPCVTRWNSYCSAFERAVELQPAFNSYIAYYVDIQDTADKGRGKSGRFGAIYEVLPVFEYLLGEFEQRYKPYELVNYEATGAPEDHLGINLKAAWGKLNDYYNRLDESAVYYAATTLHPYYKSYCDRAWRDKPSWLKKSREAFQQL
ncbi:hypothetical protein A1F96_10416 [Pyrenophora tritici-repentis]|nr:hypothetical protein A1F96_10416 [Pyrenophora tritici-repentis]